MVTVADLIRYRMANERYIHRIAEGVLPTEYGDFRMLSYESDIQTGHRSRRTRRVPRSPHLRRPQRGPPGPTRRFSSASTPTASPATSSAPRPATAAPPSTPALREIAQAGVGALIYLHHTQRGFTIDRSAHPAKLCIHRTARGAEPEPLGAPDQRILRQVGLGGQIISDLGIRKIRLLTNHPKHVPALQGFGIEIVERVPIHLHPLNVK